MSRSFNRNQGTHTRPRKIREFDKQQWGENHGVNANVIAFDWGRLNQIDALAAIRNLIEEAPATMRSFTVTQIGEEIGINTIGVSQQLQPLAELHGAWRIDPIDGSSEMTFMNPEYTHIDELAPEYTVTEATDRLQVLERLAGCGVTEMKDAAPRFGIQVSSVNRFARRHDFSWQTKRSAGLHRMIRTWAVLLDWGYTLRELGEAFGYEPTSVRTMITRKLDADFEPPVDPTRSVTESPPNLH